MNIDNAITAALRQDGDKVYLDSADQDVAPPFFVWAHVGGFDHMTLDGPTGQSETVIQLDAWGTTAAMAKTLIDRGVSKLQNATAFDVNAVDVAGSPSYDFDTNWYRRSREVTIFYQP